MNVNVCPKESIEQAFNPKQQDLSKQAESIDCQLEPKLTKACVESRGFVSIPNLGLNHLLN